MAKATKTTKQVTKTVTVDEEVVLLELSIEEAETLNHLCRRVGGIGPYRDHVNSISEAISRMVGVPSWRESRFSGEIFTR